MMPDTPPPSSLPSDSVTADPATMPGRSRADVHRPDDASTINIAPSRRDALSTEALAAFMDASSVALDLPLAPAHRPGVLRYLGIAAAMARTLEHYPLSERVEPAVRFEPVSPPSRAATADVKGIA